MRTLLRSRRMSAYLAALMAMLLVLASTAAVDAKKPPKPPPTPTPTPTTSSGVATIEIAPTGTLEPSGEYANVDVTVTCPVGWTFSSGWIYVRRDTPGGSGSFTASCTGTPQVGHARVVNGNRFQLGDWTALAFVRLTRNGQEVTDSSTRTIALQPGVTARVAAEGQLTGTSGGGVKLAVAVACPIGATPNSSVVTVSQAGTAQGTGSFTPICDRFSHTVVVPITASFGTFQTGSAVGETTVTVGWNGGSFYGIDNRAITLLQSSTGDTTPPTMPAGLSASTFGDTETWLQWGASTDNATPTGLIVYEVWLNDRFDQAIGGGYTQAILYVDPGVLNVIEVFAVDGAGNPSAPATVEVDMRF